LYAIPSFDYPAPAFDLGNSERQADTTRRAMAMSEPKFSTILANLFPRAESMAESDVAPSCEVRSHVG
jgi:hypothetical protein